MKLIKVIKELFKDKCNCNNASEVSERWVVVVHLYRYKALGVKSFHYSTYTSIVMPEKYNNKDYWYVLGKSLEIVSEMVGKDVLCGNINNYYNIRKVYKVCGKFKDTEDRYFMVGDY